MAAEFFAMVGVSMLLDSLGKMRAQLNPTLSVTGIVPTRVTHTRHATEVIDQVQAQLADRYRFFSPIPEGVAVRDAAAAGVPVTEYAPTSKPAEAYRLLAKEILA
jgi:chromosome partitioning protein